MHPNILAERYASAEIQDLWSPYNVILLGREFWIAVLREQSLNLEGEAKKQYEDAIRSYERVKGTIDVEQIAWRERLLRHDVAADITEFNCAAGFGLIHSKMTSRDKTENVEQLLIHESMRLIRDRTVAILRRLRDRAQEFATLDMCGRSHNTPAQVTTLGKRFANIAEELIHRFDHLDDFLFRYAFRGIKGPMGTQVDQKLNEFGVFAAMDQKLNQRVLRSVGQIYPRTIDLETVSVLVELAAPLVNFAKLVRLMSGLDFVHEGFVENQVGSSIMGHKINARTCERICGLFGVLKGHRAMIEHIAGDQWYEGDVSCSVVRRVVFPDAFFALDGLYEAVMTVLDEMVVFPKMIEAELRRYQPFLATTALLNAAIDRGMDRETAHELIRWHAIAAVHRVRRGSSNNFIKMLAFDPKFPLDRSDIEDVVSRVDHGEAEQQIEAVSRVIDKVISANKEVAKYNPHPIR